LSIPISDLAYYNPELKEWVVEAMEYELFVGNSSSEKDLMQTVFELK
jgi:beta-glucosidase